MGFPGGPSGKEPACQTRLDMRDVGQSLDQEDPLKGGRTTHSSVLALESHGQWSLVGYTESDTAKCLSIISCCYGPHA